MKSDNMTTNEVLCSLIFTFYAFYMLQCHRYSVWSKISSFLWCVFRMAMIRTILCNHVKFCCWEAVTARSVSQCTWSEIKDLLALHRSSRAITASGTSVRTLTVGVGGGLEQMSTHGLVIKWPLLNVCWIMFLCCIGDVGLLEGLGPCCMYGENISLLLCCTAGHFRPWSVSSLCSGLFVRSDCKCLNF